MRNQSDINRAPTQRHRAAWSLSSQNGGSIFRVDAFSSCEPAYPCSHGFVDTRQGGLHHGWNDRAIDNSGNESVKIRVLSASAGTLPLVGDRHVSRFLHERRIVLAEQDLTEA
jgi:hypothetical protein